MAETTVPAGFGPESPALLAKIRASMRIERKQFAEALGLSLAALRLYENDHYPVPQNVMERAVVLIGAHIPGHLKQLVEPMRAYLAERKQKRIDFVRCSVEELIEDPVKYRASRVFHAIHIFMGEARRSKTTALPKKEGSNTK